MLTATDKSHLLSKQQQQHQQQDPAAAALALTAADVVDTLEQICHALRGGKQSGTNNAAGAAGAAAAAAAANGSSGVAESLMTCMAKLAVKLPEQVKTISMSSSSICCYRCCFDAVRGGVFVLVLSVSPWSSVSFPFSTCLSGCVRRSAVVCAWCCCCRGAGCCSCCSPSTPAVTWKCNSGVQNLLRCSSRQTGRLRT